MGIGYIPYNITAPISATGFGTTVAADNLSFNKFREIFEPSLGATSQNSIGTFFDFVKDNACGPNLPSIKQGVSIQDFDQSSAYVVTVYVKNIAQNVYGTATTGALKVEVTKGTRGAGDFYIQLGGTINMGVSSAEFTGLGGALVVPYDLIIKEQPSPGPTNICESTFRITMVSENTVPNIKRTSPNASNTISFGNPSTTGYSSPVSLFNASNSYSP